MIKKISRLSAIFSLVLLSIFVTSCQKEGKDTLVLPIPIRSIPENVLSLDTQDSLRAHGMDIYEGVFNDELKLEGRYEMHPMRLLYASDEYDNQFYDLVFRFSNQKMRGFITYDEDQQEIVYGEANKARLIGHDSCFTMFCKPVVFKTRGEDTLYKCYLVTVISGIVREEGLGNCKYSYSVDSVWAKSDYYLSQVPAAGTNRIWMDNDSISYKL